MSKYMGKGELRLEPSVSAPTGTVLQGTPPVQRRPMVSSSGSMSATSDTAGQTSGKRASSLSLGIQVN